MKLSESITDRLNTTLIFDVITVGMRSFCLLLLAGVILLLTFSSTVSADFYVATDGSDTTGDGSDLHPWATITHALDNVPDASIISVKPGIYQGRVRIRGTFSYGVIVRSQIPYAAILRSNEHVMTAYADPRGCSGIIIEGFEIEHIDSGAEPLMVHVDGNGEEAVSLLIFRNNIFHDSYNNDLLKINNSAHSILVEGNMFYNQTGSDEHIDINSARNVTIQDNIFFNDFQGSGRQNYNNTSSYIVIKDSNGDDDLYLGSENITVQRNIFLNWEGSTGSNFVLIGEDGHPYYEARNVTVDNNLMIGNSENTMRAAVGVKGGENIFFRYNTVVGDLPSLAYAMRLNIEGSNPANSNIRFYSNIWADPYGTMGAQSSGGSNDFSDTPFGETSSFTLEKNLYWNGGSAIPENPGDLVNYTDDPTAVIANPNLSDQTGLDVPRWNRTAGTFNGGFLTVRQAFLWLVYSYGRPTGSSPGKDIGSTVFAPADDILGNPRNQDAGPDIGAYEDIPQIPSLSLFGLMVLIALCSVCIRFSKA